MFDASGNDSQSDSGENVGVVALAGMVGLAAVGNGVEGRTTRVNGFALKQKSVLL